MGAYNFKFEKILNLKQKEEEQQEDKYLKLKTELKNAEQKLLDLKNEKEAVYADLREKENDLCSNIDFRNYLKKLRKKEKILLEEIADKEREVASQLQLLMEKKKERKILEKLKEKEEEKFIKEFLAEEQKELDELSINYSMGGRLI